MSVVHDTDIFSKCPSCGGNCNPPQPLPAPQKFSKSILCLIKKFFRGTIILWKNIRFPSSKIKKFYSVKLYFFYKNCGAFCPLDSYFFIKLMSVFYKNFDVFFIWKWVTFFLFFWQIYVIFFKIFRCVVFQKSDVFVFKILMFLF